MFFAGLTRSNILHVKPVANVSPSFSRMLSKSVVGDVDCSKLERVTARKCPHLNAPVHTREKFRIWSDQFVLVSMYQNELRPFRF